MPWSAIIPTSIAHLGAFFLVLAVFLVLVDKPGGKDWSKIAGWFAAIGGFGVGGGVGGFIGSHLASGRGQLVSTGQQFTNQALGTGVGVAVVACLLLWAWFRLAKGGKGGEASKGKGITLKVKSLLVLAIIALAGTALAAFPWIHPAADEAMHWAGSRVISMLPG